MAESFSGLIKSNHDRGLWQGIHLPNTSISVTHSLFVDDTLLYVKSSVQEAIQMKKALELYTSLLGQQINTHKSIIYILNTKAPIRKNTIKTLGFKENDLPSI